MRKGFCVGINHFQRPGNDLSGCIPDAKEMRHLLMGHLEVEDGLDYLVDGAATKANTIELLTNLVNTPGLTYLGISWSGHGTHYNRPEEADGLGEALVCFDLAEQGGDWDPATIITDVEFKALLNQVPASCVVEVWLDTCYSGGMSKSLVPWVQTPRFLHNPGNTGEVMRLSNSTLTQGLSSNIIMWCACSEAQTSADAFIQGGPHGAFTYFWGEAFRHNLNASRVELLLLTRTALKAAGYEQFPRLKAWNASAQRRVGR